MKIQIQCIAFLTGLLLSAVPSVRGLPAPAWTATNFAFRAVCDLPETVRDAFLVRIPVPDSAPPVNSIQAEGPDGAPLAVRVVTAATTTLTLVVAHPEGLPLDRKQPCVVYFGHRAGAPALDPDPSPVTGLPVLGSLRPIAGRGRPATWERIHYMFFQPGATQRFMAPGVEPFVYTGLFERDVAEDALEAFRERHKAIYENDHFIRLETWVRAPEPGAYHLTLQNRGLGVVLVDGVTVLTSEVRAEPTETVAGDPVLLSEAGNRIEVFVMGRQRSEARLGWIPPQGTESLPLRPGDYLAPVEVVPRLERVDYPLHADFTIQQQRARPFAFRGSETIFVPVVLVNRSRNWTGQPLTLRWYDEAGRLLGEGDRIEFVLKGPAIHTLRLEVRDRLGFSTVAERTFDTRRIEPDWFAVDIRLLDVPAVCYPEDVVMPALYVTGQTPAGYPGALEWRIEANDSVADDGHPLPLSGSQTEVVPIGRFKAGALHRIDWSFYVEGKPLVSGNIRFLRPPFTILPESVEGDALVGADGVRLVLLPYRYAGDFQQPGLTRERMSGQIVCLDDFLTRHGRRTNPEAQSPFARVLSRAMGGSGAPGVTVLELKGAVPPHEVYTPLKEFITVPRLLLEHKADVAVLSKALGEILRRRHPDLFERQMAALSDLVSATLGIPVIWVTPPPYGPEPEQVRPYAVAVRRVADARAIPVADLYSAFATADMQSGPPVFVEWFDLDLTPEAEIHAARIVARAMFAIDAGRPWNTRVNTLW